MVAARLLFLPGCLLLAVIILESSWAQAAEKKAVVAGAPLANIRVGAGIGHAIRATLKEGDQVSVGKLDGEWYEVTTADGQNGYVHRSLLSVGGETSSPQPAQAADKNRIGTPTTEPIGATGTTSQVVAGEAAKVRQSKALEPADAPKESPAPPAKSPSIVQMLEGHENELMIAAAIAAAFFFIGWICGGNYYLRRERRQRNRIRF